MTDIDNPLFAQEEVPIRHSLIRRLAIESVTATAFEIKNGIHALDGFKSHLLMYGRSGNRIRHEKFNREGKLIYEWIYDERGRPLREIAYEESGKSHYRVELIYNPDDDWREKRVYLSGNDIHYSIAADREANDRLTKEIYYDSSNQRVRTDSYVYDDYGRLVRVSMGHMGEWIYEYDGDNNLRKKTGLLPSSSVLGEEFEFQYDHRGMLVQSNHLHYSSTVFECTFFR
jgi:nuclear transport factor 2 (NTF2) superfamily protein